MAREKGVLRARGIEVPEKDPYRYDLFNRKEFVEGFKDELLNSEGVGVYVVDGGWGTGKTTFAKMLRCALMPSMNGRGLVSIDACQTEWEQAPVIALASAFDKDVRLNFTLDALVASLPAIMPTHDRRENFSLLHVKDLRILHSDRERSREKIREELEKYVLRKCYGHPLVAIVDELDRCRPAYALEMLKDIKYLFDIEKVIFVLVVNVSQLKTFVRTIYGKDTDTEGYLRAFFDAEIRLPFDGLERWHQTDRLTCISNQHA